MDKTKVTKDLEHKTLILERVFDAPLQRVWDAFTIADQFVQWWGPEGWNTTVKAFDFVPGGVAHYCMKCVDESQGEWFGQESWGLMEFKDIEVGTSYGYDDYFSDETGARSSTMPVAHCKQEFIEDGGKTLVKSTTTYDSVEQLEEVLKMGMVEGYSSSMDKLDLILK